MRRHRLVTQSHNNFLSCMATATARAPWSVRQKPGKNLWGQGTTLPLLAKTACRDCLADPLGTQDMHPLAMDSVANARMPRQGCRLRQSSRTAAANGAFELPTPCADPGSGSWILGTVAESP